MGQALGVTHVVRRSLNLMRDVLPRHNPAFRKRCVHAEKPGATQVVSLTSLSRKGSRKALASPAKLENAFNFTDVGRFKSFRS